MAQENFSEDYSASDRTLDAESYSDGESYSEPFNLDSAYAVSKKIAKKPESETWWSKNKNIMRTIFFVAAAGSAGIAIWQNSEASNEKDNAAIWHNNAQHYAVDQNMQKYRESASGYEKTVDNVKFHENMRNGFYVGAGVFGVAGIVSLCF